MIAYSIQYNYTSGQRGKISTYSQTNPGTLDENKNPEVRAIKILLDSGASVSIVRKKILLERYKILKDKKNI